MLRRPWLEMEVNSRADRSELPKSKGRRELTEKRINSDILNYNLFEFFFFYNVIYKTSINIIIIMFYIHNLLLN